MTTKRFTHKKWLDDRQLFDGDEPFAIVDVYIQAEEICNKLNELHEENTYLKLELDSHKHPLWSTREAGRKVSGLTDLLMTETKKNAILLEEINSLRKENMRLKEVQKYE